MSRKEIIVVIVVASIVSILLMAAIIPRSVPPGNVAAKVSCIATLKQIDGAMQQWALERKGTNRVQVPVWLESQNETNLVPTWQDLSPYLNRTPVCPRGGTYILGSIAQGPQCSIFLHSLELGWVYVTDENGAIMTNALVSVYEGASEWESYRTDAEGEIRVDVYSKDATATRIVASKEGFQEASSPVEVRWPIRFKLKKK